MQIEKELRRIAEYQNSLLPRHEKRTEEALDVIVNDLSSATQKTLEDILQPMACSVESNLACMLKKIIAEFLLQRKSNLFFCWGYYHFNTSKQLTFRTYQRTLFKQYKNKRSIELYGSLDT